MKDRRGRALTVAVLLAVLAGCGADEASQSQAATSSATPSSPFDNTADSVAVKAGTYRMPSSSTSLTGYTVTFPEGWTVKHGYRFRKHGDTVAEFGFYPALVDGIYADGCVGSEGEVLDVGPSVDDLATALLEQAGPDASDPVKTTLGGYPAIRIDLFIPDDSDLEGCSLPDAMQIWLVPPANYTVLFAEGKASTYVVDVNGQRQVFWSWTGSATSDEDLRELQTVLDSIQIET